MLKLKQPLPKRSRIPITVENLETLVTDGKNFYLKKDANGEYPLTVVTKVGDDPSYWTYLDLDGRTYRPNIPSTYLGNITDGTKLYSGLAGAAAKAWDNATDWASTIDVGNLFHPVALTIRETKEGRNPVVAAALFFDPTGVATVVPRLAYNIGTDNTGVSDVVDAGLLSLPFAGKAKQLRRVLPVRMRANSETIKRLESMQDYRNGVFHEVSSILELPDNVINEHATTLAKYFDNDIKGYRVTPSGRTFIDIKPGIRPVQPSSNPNNKKTVIISRKNPDAVELEISFPEDSVPAEAASKPTETPKTLVTETETLKNESLTVTDLESESTPKPNDKKPNRVWTWMKKHPYWTGIGTGFTLHPTREYLIKPFLNYVGPGIGNGVTTIVAGKAPLNIPLVANDSSELVYKGGIGKVSSQKNKENKESTSDSSNTSKDTYDLPTYVPKPGKRRSAQEILDSLKLVERNGKR